MKITCDAEEKRLLEKALMCHCGKMKLIRKKRASTQKRREEGRVVITVGVTMT